MFIDSPITWVARSVAILVFCCAIAGCDNRVPTSAATSDATPGSPAIAPAQTREAVLASMEGVWATAEKKGTDDDETVYIVQRDAGALRFFRNGNIEIPIVTEDVDIANGTVTVRHEQDGLTEVLTFQRINAENSVKSDGFGMRLTYGNGRYADLRFVRRLAAADIDVIREIRESDRKNAARLARMLSAGVDCHSPSGFRAKMVCDDFEIRDKQEALMSVFDHLSFDYPVDIKSTEAAAWKQLDACKTKACLESGYKQWEQYLETNYEDELLVD